MRLQSRTALITGGARGIGLAIGRAFAREGAAVALGDVDGDSAELAAAELAASGGPALGLAMDVADPASVEAAVALVGRELGPISILVNNAGIGGNTPILDTTLEQWERIVRINLTGSFLVTQAVARGMAKAGAGGAMVNIVSVSGQRGGDGRAAYGSAKAGLELFTKVAAVEFAPLGIRVNAIAPGPIETEMARFAHDQASREAYNYLVPMVRYGTPEEIADAAVFLASDKSAYVTGHTLNVDGGYRAGGLMHKKWKARTA